MQIVGLLLMFGGYVLVYAGMANHGEFVSNPWAGIFSDAYPSVKGGGAT
jgi:hypothetical protein